MLAFLCPAQSFAQSGKAASPAAGFQFNHFGEQFNARGMFTPNKYKNVKLKNLGDARREIARRKAFEMKSGTDATAIADAQIQVRESAADAARDEAKTDRKWIYVGEDHGETMRAPDAKPRLRMDRDAPPEFVGMVDAELNGDVHTAKEYAKAFVRYNMNMFFKVRDYTKLIGAALIDEGVIDDEDWYGVEQYLDYTLAESRAESGALLKPDHSQVLKRITPVKNGKIEIFWFFSLDSSHSRLMAPDVERLWQVAKNDPNIKMVALSLNTVPDNWIDSYRQYTGLTLPIYDGAEVAKTFGVAYPPTLVVASPTENIAYTRSGQQEFLHMYEFVRTIQGKPTTLSAGVKRLMASSVGKLEKLKGDSMPIAQKTRTTNSGSVRGLQKVKSREKVSRF